MRSRLNDVRRLYGGRRAPDWRAEAASQLLRERHLADGADDDVRQLLTYRRLAQAAGAQQAAGKFPLLAAVEEFSADVGLVGYLKLLVLARAPLAAIAQRTLVPEDAIALWKRLYFDVDGSLDAWVWVALQIIRPEREKDPLLACKMMAALHGGLAAVDELLACETRLPLDASALQRRNESLVAMIAAAAVTSAELVPSECLDWITLFVRQTIAQSRSVEVAKRREMEQTYQQKKIQIEQAKLDLEQQRVAQRVTERQQRVAERERIDRELAARVAKRESSRKPLPISPWLRPWPLAPRDSASVAGQLNQAGHAAPSAQSAKPAAVHRSSLTAPAVIADVSPVRLSDSLTTAAIPMGAGASA